VRVRLLGPVDVVVEGKPTPVRGHRRTAVLAALAVQAGAVVSTGHLIDGIWGDAAPKGALPTLQSHISYLRRLFGTRNAIVARGSGYALELGPDATDVALAERLIEEVRRSTELEFRVHRLEAVVALWRGRPLADVAMHSWLEQEAGRLEQLGLTVRRDMIETRLEGLSGGSRES